MCEKRLHSQAVGWGRVGGAGYEGTIPEDLLAIQILTAAGLYEVPQNLCHGGLRPSLCSQEQNHKTYACVYGCINNSYR